MLAESLLRKAYFIIKHLPHSLPLPHQKHFLSFLGFEERRQRVTRGVETFPCELPPARCYGLSSCESSLLLPFFPQRFLIRHRPCSKASGTLGPPHFHLCGCLGKVSFLSSVRGLSLIVLRREKEDVPLWGTLPLVFLCDAETDFLGRVRFTSLFCILTVNGA